MDRTKKYKEPEAILVKYGKELAISSEESKVLNFNVKKQNKVEAITALLWMCIITLNNDKLINTIAN